MSREELFTVIMPLKASFCDAVEVNELTQKSRSVYLCLLALERRPRYCGPLNSPPVRELTVIRFILWCIALRPANPLRLLPIFAIVVIDHHRHTLYPVEYYDK